MYTKANLLLLAVLTATALSCNSGKQSADETPSQPEETQHDWILLFDGETLHGWHGFNQAEEVGNWVVEDGLLTCLGKTDESNRRVDLVTDVDFSNFELEWEWKISEGGNSGLLYHVVEDPKYRSSHETGPEYQLIDEIGFPGTLESWQLAAANYAMNPADNAKKELKPVGEWNLSKIVYDNGHVEHWLNDQKVVSFEEETPEWNQEKEEGKWKDYPDYKRVNKGKIALQDHGDPIWFRNIRIKELP